MKQLLFLLLLAPLACMAQPDTKSCTATLVPFETVWRGQLKARIMLAKNYYFDDKNHLGTLEHRKSMFNSEAEKTFSEFRTKRTNEYAVMKCHIDAYDRNRGKRKSWKTIACDPGFVFVEKSLHIYGSYPTFLENDTKFSWRTGATSHVALDEVPGNIDKLVTDEINLVRKDLADVGIPTELP